MPLYVTQIGMDDSSGVFVLYGGLILALRLLGARVPDRIGPFTAGTIATGTSAAGLLIMAAFAEPVGLYAGTIVFSIGMSFLYPAMLTLALTGLADNERGSAVGTVSSFFDLSQGVGALLLGVVAALTGYRGAFVAGALLGLAALVLLRGSTDARTRASSATVQPPSRAHRSSPTTPDAGFVRDLRQREPPTQAVGRVRCAACTRSTNAVTSRAKRVASSTVGCAQHLGRR